MIYRKWLIGLWLLSSLAGARPSPFEAPLNSPEPSNQLPQSTAQPPVPTKPQKTVPEPELEQVWVVLRHAQAGQIKSFLAQDPLLLSVQGVALVDARTNRILLRETPTRIAAMKAIIAELDAPLQQIQLEARIVQLN